MFVLKLILDNIKGCIINHKTIRKEVAVYKTLKQSESKDITCAFHALLIY